MNWSVVKNGKILMKGNPSDVREFLETMLVEKTGLFLSLQEDEDEGYIYLHSEYSEELTDDEIQKVSDLGINEDYDETTILAMEKLLDIKILTNREE